MKKILLSIMLLYGSASFAKIHSMNEIRSLYQKAAIDERSCSQLIELLSSYYVKNNPLLFGYKASGTMMMAKHVFNPFTKLSYFKKGKKMLEKAIAVDGKNVELRFLRFAAQTNIPSFLGYHDNIAIDKEFLLESLPQLTDITLRGIVVSYLKNSDYLTDNQKQKIK